MSINAPSDAGRLIEQCAGSGPIAKSRHAGAGHGCHIPDRRDLADPVVERVRDIQITAGIDRNSPGVAKLGGNPFAVDITRLPTPRKRPDGPIG